MKRVLVVEDEASIREMVALNLKMAGWEVVEAPSAERAPVSYTHLTLPTNREV